MKSVLDVMSDSVPDEVQAIAEDVIREWEGLSGEYATFRLKSVGEWHKVSSVGGVYTPYLLIGKSFTFFMDSSGNSDGGLYLDSEGRWKLVIKDGGHEPLIPSDGRLGTNCNAVRDIFNIQPHEYGMLKLKYGLTKEMMFVPSYLKKFTPKGCDYD